VLRVAGSSTRALPSMSAAGSPLTPESAESIAGDPSVRWKSPVVRLFHFGSA
jgi:hypothetical protein